MNPNNRIYIGQTKNISKRKHDYKKGNCKSQCKLYNSIIKYGWDQHTFEIIEANIENLDEANEREIYWISYYNTVIDGLNILPGGNLRIFSEESKEKMRQAKLGKISWKKGLKGISNHSEETKNKIKVARNLRPLKIKKVKEKKEWKLTEEGRMKIIQSNLGKKHTEETILKMKQRIPWNKGLKLN